MSNQNESVVKVSKMAETENDNNSIIRPERNNRSLVPNNGPRRVTIYKTETGFGFNVRGQVSEGGQLRSINGELYAPLQHVSAVLEQGAAELAGIRKGDRILEVNGVNVEGSTHRQVVDLIKSGGDCLTLTVISVTPREAERLEPCDDGSAPVGVIGGAANSRATVYQRYDYTDKRSLPVSIPDYRVVMERNTGRSYIAFNVHMAGRHLCSRRYREFAALHQQLRKEFLGFNFPKLPGKWPFNLSEQQLDSRRRGLELYLEKVCAVRVIAESEAVQEFLTDSDDSSNPSPVDLKVLLPDKEVVTVSVLKSTNADDVYRAVCEKIGLSKSVQKYFYLFEIVEYNFERKLQPNECPHSLYIQNYSTASSSCLSIRKWLFNPDREISIVKEDSKAAAFIFWQAVEDVNRGVCVAGARLYQLKALQEVRRAADYLALARSLPGYGALAFPPARTDCRAAPALALTVAWPGLTLRPCGDQDTTTAAAAEEVRWRAVREWRVDDDAAALRLAYGRHDLLLYTPYYQFLCNCMDRIAEEATWVDTGD
ncbi:sorting nexin-27 isoform X1 [Galleria mellonella]|uniref:Sorting nexin-27 isoform X1 n=1 Tax=Galleria mellonella TaxID=7137 RepID=A0ABM3MWN9_GALME|nr:sorting nexin-27 isoform X1 [Galleria mellonella]